MMKKDIKLILSPDRLHDAYGSKYLSPEAMQHAIMGAISEERYMTNRCYPCPFCGERKSVKFYENYEPNNDKCTTSIDRVLKQSGIAFTEDPQRPRGLSIEEKPYKKLFSKDEWFVKQYHCLSCGSIYESRPYRKKQFVSLI